MNLSVELIKTDLTVFADIGTGTPLIYEEDNHIVAIFFRNGERLTVRLQKANGQVSIVRADQPDVRYASFRALLASEVFGNLRSWAAAQYQLLRDLVAEDDMLPTQGDLATENGLTSGDIDKVDAFLTAEQKNNVRVLLIDGPAGIGKTRFIEQLSFRRARDFVTTQQPLILHVKSRGRVLTYLQDLMAFSLQSMRLQVTYDQAPILVRHGLVQLAIDGFDELGDPNGYDTAWAQIRELIEGIKGAGCTILSGRETFIGRERLLKAVPRLADTLNEIGVFSISPVQPHVAKGWLKKTVPEKDIQSAADWGLFDEGSYALRPFFIAHIAHILADGGPFEASPPLVALTQEMIKREAQKFPESLSTIWSTEQRERFVYSVLGEVARDMAENQSESIDEESLIWIVDTSLGDDFDSEISRLLKNRVQAIAFLQSDERNGRRRFAHSEFYNFFLSYVTISTLSNFEVPKFVRRNLFSTDFLVTFGIVFDSEDTEIVRQFVGSTKTILLQLSGLDRADRNIGALLLSVTALGGRAGLTELTNLNVDDAVIRGVTDSVKIKESTINQLDIRECDLSSVSFNDVNIATLVADEITRLPPSFPDVGFLQLIIHSRETSIAGSEARQWLDEHGRLSVSESSSQIISDRDKQHTLYKLLQRVCRVMLRQHWIRSDGNDPVTRFIEDEQWPVLCELLRAQGLLEERADKPASGPPSTFYHVRHAHELLIEDKMNSRVVDLLKSIRNVIQNSPSAIA